MERQTEISWRLRKSLIIWLIEVHLEYDLRLETLYLCINLIDRVCSKRCMTKQDYQLLGITSLWIAAKYEENHGKVPPLKNLILICCGNYQERDFIAMEQVILSDVQFMLGHPTAEAFLKAHYRYLKDIPPHSRALARYIMEISLVHRRFMAFRPSLIATASLIMADAIHGRRFWAHSDPHLARVLAHLEDCLGNPPKVIFEKYSSEKFLHVSHSLKSWLEAK